MRTWAVFIYGVAAGLLVSWAVSVLFASPALDRLVIGAAAVLAIGLVVHQRHISLSKGRRWKKTV